MKARTIVAVLALTLSLVLLGQRAGTEEAVGTEFGGDLPVGSIVVYAGSTPPEGWLLCDGALYDVLAYPELFNVVEFTYGGNTEKTAFQVPNLKGKVPVGMTAGTGTAYWYCNQLGMTGGTAEVSLTEAEMPAHSHSVHASSHGHDMDVSPHTHAVSVTSHTHSLNDPGHSHGTTDPGHDHSITDPGHRHTIDLDDAFGGNGIDNANPSDEMAFGLTDYAKTGITISSTTTGIRINSVRTAITLESATVPVSLKNTTVDASVENANVKILEESKGSGQAHNNLPPYMALNYIIKY